MEMSGIGSLTSALSQAKTGDAVGTLVLKKALDIERQNALQLVEALPQAGGVNNPAHLGRSVDVKA